MTPWNLYGIGIMVFCFTKPVFLVEPCPWPELFLWIRVFLSILMSFCPVWKVCWNWLISFSKFWYGVRNSCEVVYDSWIFWKKKMFYWKIWSSTFSKFCLKWKFMLFTIFLPRSHIWGKSGSWDMGQKALD